jgi:signal transduction protein with GAF and PtsI domain
MKVKITYVGIPMGVVGATPSAGFNVEFEYNGKRGSAFIKPGDDMRAAISNAIDEQARRERLMAEATKFAEEVKRLIGCEIDIP